MADMKTTTGVKTILVDASKAVESAKDWLEKAAEAPCVHEPDTNQRIETELNALDGLLLLLGQAQAAPDDELSVKALGAIKPQAAMLHASSDRVKAIALRYGEEQKFSTEIENAMTFMSQAAMFIKALP